MIINRPATLMLVCLLAGCSTYQASSPVPGGSQQRTAAGAPGSDRYEITQDRAPSDAERTRVANLPDPTPQNEPRSRYGNGPTYTVWGESYRVLDSAQDYREDGNASWYGVKFHGHRTSSGEAYDMYQLSAAHKTLPLPTWARVTNLDNGKSTVVRINDRGPFHPDRIIDLSWAAAVKLDIDRRGTGRVRVEALSGEPQQASPTMTEAPAATGWYLQSGAFGELAAAERNRDQVAALGNWSSQIRTHANLHRVWIGPFANPSLRDQARETFINRGISVININPD